MRALITYILCATTTFALFAWSVKGDPIVFTSTPTEINGKSPGRIGFPKSEAAISIRPQTSLPQSITFENYFIHDLTNQKGLEVKVTDHFDGTPAWAYESITLRNLKIYDVNRDQSVAGAAGLHIDHIRISGAAKQNHAINLVLENIDIDGGDALPILIADGVFNTITIRNVSIKNTTNSVQIKTNNVGHIGQIIIDDSPGLGVALIGRPGSIDSVLVTDSPNARIGDTLVNGARSGAIITTYQTPEPGFGGLAITAAVLGMFRRPGSFLVQARHPMVLA